jgi:hypothetical protein
MRRLSDQPPAELQPLRRFQKRGVHGHPLHDWPSDDRLERGF